MSSINEWWANHKPSRRRLIQIYAALLYNAHGSGFITGEIYDGTLKNICVPGLNCYSCPGAIGACPLGALQNALATSGHRAPWYVLGIILLSGLLLGRRICGFLCPVGLIQELLYKIPVPKMRKCRFTHILSRLKYMILAIFVIGIPLIYAFPAFCRYICPAGTLAGVGLLSAASDRKGILSMIGLRFTAKVIVAMLFVIAAAFIFRVFCRFFCPLGAIYGLFSKIAIFGIDVDTERCNGCNRCVRSCRMDIRRPGDHECIQCGECMEVCTEGAIQIRRGRIRLEENDVSRKPRHKRVIAAAAIALLAVIIIAVNPPLRSRSARETGTVCPPFAVSLYGGGEFCPQNEKGRPAIMNFWATWCAPCLDELPYFDQIYREYGDEIAMALIHADGVTEDVQAFLDRRNITAPVGLDANGSVKEILGVGSLLPYTVVLDSEGNIIYSQAGSLDYDQLEKLVLLARTGTAVPDENAAPAGEYTFICRDQNGEPVQGVMINICGETFCSPVFTDAEGKAVFKGPPLAYDVQILSVPEGYQFDAEESCKTDTGYESMELIITKTEQSSD